MADSTLTAPRALRRWSALPVAARIAMVYVAARLVTTAFLLLASALAVPGSRFGASPSLGSFVVGWDATWYWFTAVNGYPDVLPRTAAGLVSENQWAFMPVYAYASAAVGLLLGSWGAGALVISLVSGYLSCLVLHRILRPRIGARAAFWAVVLFSCAPLAAMFQVGYAESLFLLWMLLALDAVMRRRYGLLYLLIPLMGFTRPGVLAFALFLGLFGVWRLATRDREPLRAREVVHILGTGALAVIVGFSWQVIAGIVTGDPTAYLATELAWRRNWLPGGESGFVPFEGFVQAAAFWFTSWGLGPVVGYVVLAASVVLIAVVLVAGRSVRRLGVELRLWAASYLLYILLVFFPQSSIFRLLLPLSPLWGAVAVPRSKVWRFGVLAVSLLAQWWWIYNMYALGYTYWQIP
ncbi:hypothetical protein CVS47_01849 [Microbacterium lemovicicum]|uniref:Glycosyltransferase RgtA/B/C/D-like domain-containing protein n=1 Tax=Microbacterium lemovicicum TaxID=1072463 RepID=A0A3S9WAY3_9MICO|nr:hypothetical protein [Microbacterium lemovicicum]AZS37217.1 hypothetical protein CVS47_01849 [Microbacterium lemovicicum]